MIIKKFQAETEKEAILLAQNELGKDAIVMNIKTMNPKGIFKMFRKSKVEVTAAIDEKEEGTFKVQMKQAEEASKQEEKKKEEKEVILEGKKEEKESAIEEKLNNLAKMIEKEMELKKESSIKEKEGEEEKKEENKETEKKDSKEDYNRAMIELVQKQLMDHEVEQEFAREIVKDIENKKDVKLKIDDVLANVYQRIVLKLGQPDMIELEHNTGNGPKLIYFIGPTGVGKTTTIAKIASKLKLEKKAKVALITADTYRIAAVEQIRTYANILSIPIKVVYEPEEIKKTIEEFSDYDLILVDTAGRSHKNEEQCNDLKSLLEASKDYKQEIYLVLSAATKYRDLVKITETYSKITNYKLIFTKLDETGCLGNILNIRMLTKLPLSYATNGQNVPDDICVLDAQNIAKQLLGGSD
ncbi:MAG: flagellar biosynthesis protein FlhF [Lachnospiraceae bacterium]|nr:flagellar biosynthesis protein FlhF [Lachnospiraceae bacterium]